MKKVFCHISENTEEISKCYRIREEVFVREQKLFKNSDRDKFDKNAIHICAEYNGEIVGTVRVFEIKDGVWFGGRLAVLKKARRGDTAKLLVKKAVQTTKSKAAKKFLAWVQEANVNFFLRLGWKKTGREKKYLGKSHQLMEANLSLSSENSEP